MHAEGSVFAVLAGSMTAILVAMGDLYKCYTTGCNTTPMFRAALCKEHLKERLIPLSRALLHAGSWLLQVRTASCGALNCVNTFGDEQLAVDVLADKLLFEALKYSVRARCCAAHRRRFGAEHSGDFSDFAERDSRHVKDFRRQAMPLCLARAALKPCCGSDHGGELQSYAERVSWRLWQQAGGKSASSGATLGGAQHRC